MRAFIGAAVLSVMLAAAPTFAQAPAPAAPAPAAPAPAAPAPAAAQATATEVVPAFPVGTKYALINIQRVAAESAEGKAANTRVQTLQTIKLNDLNKMNQNLQGLQQKLDAGANVMSVAAATALQREIERATTDIQRFTEDAQAEVTNLTTQLQADFEQKLSPIISAVAMERGLHLLFSMADSGLVWGDPSLDITTEVINRFNLAPTSSAQPPAAARPPAAAPAPARPAAPAPAAPRPAAPATPTRP